MTIACAFIKISPSTSRFILPFCLFAAIGFGAYLRLDQVLYQVLINDEWHPVHQLTYYSPQQFMGSFGNADYSIPLVLFYWLEMQLFSVNELTLRMPMIIAGLLTLIALPMSLRNRVDDRVVALFAVLLAMSPFLISYARIARPYALTLLGIYAAFWCLERAIENRKIRWKPAFGYALLCGLVVWTHAITGPVLIAPLVVLWWAAFRGIGLAWGPIIMLTLVVGVIMGLAVLPPLLGDPTAISGKSGVDSITLETVYGAAFLWFGTGSTAVVIASVLLTAIGAPMVWRKMPIARWMVVGIALTVVTLLVTRPWWVDRPLAFGRYLLPVVPLLLLSVSAGLVRVSDGFHKLARKGAASLWTLTVAVPFFAACWITSPTPEILLRPNSYTQDSYFQYDYRKERNGVRLGLPTMPASAFWASLANRPPASLTIAVAPFRYATHEWPAPLWERDSHQRVMPAFLWGACEATRHGEVPLDARFQFRNAAHLADRRHLVAQRVDYLAYYLAQPRHGHNPALPHCEAWVRDHYGPPDYADAALLVWRIRPDAPLPVVAKVAP